MEGRTVILAALEVACTFVVGVAVAVAEAEVAAAAGVVAAAVVVDHASATFGEEAVKRSRTTTTTTMVAQELRAVLICAAYVQPVQSHSQASSIEAQLYPPLSGWFQNSHVSEWHVDGQLDAAAGRACSSSTASRIGESRIAVQRWGRRRASIDGLSYGV